MELERWICRTSGTSRRFDVRGVIIDFHMAALARPKDTRPVAHTTGFQYSLSVGGLVLPVFNPPAFSWWSLSDFRGW